MPLQYIEVDRWRLELQLSAGVWTDVRKDVVAANGVRWWRGNRDNGPTDRVAQPGGLEFSLRNDDGNSGRKQGYYSTRHVNRRTGFTYGIPVRVRADAGGITYTLWTGRVRTIDPEPGIARAQHTHCTAQDTYADLAETDVREISPQVSQGEATLIQAVINALPAAAQPTAVSLDASLDSYPYAFDQIGDGANALGLLQDVAVSAFGFVYGTGAGTLVYENRHTRALKDSVFTLDGDRDGQAIAAPTSLAGTFNRIRGTIHPKTTAAATVLYAATSAIAVAPGETVEVWGKYADPTQKDRLIGGTTFTTPLVAATDYTGNSLADGTGTNYTSNVAIAVTPFASTAKFVISHSAGVTVYVRNLQLRGTGIYDNAQQTVESFSAQTYGNRPLNIDLPLQDNAVVAQDFVDYVNAVYANRQGCDAVTFQANRSPRMLLAALQREIGDVVTVSETVTGTTAIEAAIQGIEMALDGGVWLTVTWALAPQDQNHSFVFDDATFGVFDSSAAVLGFA